MRVYCVVGLAHRMVAWLLGGVVLAVVVAIAAVVVSARTGRPSERLRADVTIAASAARVWAVATDLAAYPTWNPVVTQASGNVVRNGGLALHLELPGGRRHDLEATVERAEPDRLLRWFSRPYSAPGLFEVEYTLRIEPLSRRRVRVIQLVAFKGVLVPLYGDTGKARLALEGVAAALGRRAEQGEAPPP